MTTRLSKETLKQVSFLEWSSFMHDLKLVQEDILTSAYSIFEFEPLQNFHSDIPKVM